jgi:sugar/nucleoside kinase (ribokinase family)
VQDLDVVGIGNALVDVIAHHGESFLASHGLVKGAMTLIETDRAVELYSAIGSGVEMSGGSAANTMTGVASFGGVASYIGKVAGDELGEVFRHDLRAVGVGFENPPAGNGVPTGRCMIVVTPDAQRTMNTYLGVSSLLTPEDVDEMLVARAKVVYLEGYLFDRDGAKEAYRKAAAAAHGAGGKVSLTLSDSFCVDRHRAEWRKLVAEEVDVLFANEAEICALYETDFDTATEAARADCKVAALTRSEHGSVIVSGDEMHVVSAHPVDWLVDTTGAGDLYASGFLYGYTRGDHLETCGRLGSIAAAEVISHLGARPEADLSELAALLTM